MTVLGYGRNDQMTYSVVRAGYPTGGNMAISMLIAAVLQAAPLQPPGVLSLLAGEWVCLAGMADSRPVWRSETWRRGSNGTLVGLASATTELGNPLDVVPQADLTISGNGGQSIRLTYGADGRVGRYRLVRDEHEEAVFERVGSGSPRRIAYRLNGQHLEVIHVLADGGSRRWFYQRPGITQGIGGCDDRR